MMKMMMMMIMMMISCHCAGPLLSTSPIHEGRSGVVIFTPWCFMVLPIKISSHCAGPLPCF